MIDHGRHGFQGSRSTLRRSGACTKQASDQQVIAACDMKLSECEPLLPWMLQRLNSSQGVPHCRKGITSKVKMVLSFVNCDSFRMDINNLPCPDMSTAYLRWLFRPCCSCSVPGAESYSHVPTRLVPSEIRAHPQAPEIFSLPSLRESLEMSRTLLQ